ncbi:MAG: CinA family protein [Clostridia bacterium]|nr:CinA family protein [Clostridia bacterium]
MKRTINLVGYLKDDVNSFFDKIELNLKGLSFNVSERYYETTVEIMGDEELREEFIDVVRRFADTFKNFVYGINEENVYKCAYKLLKDKNLKVAFAEGVSAGRLASEFVCQNDESVAEILVEADVNLSKESQIRRYGILPSFFETYQLESVEAVYELARGGLYVSTADVIVATAGIASDDEMAVDNGKCFIAVGDNKVINVFKHNFTGSKNKIMQQLAKFSFLHLIKKLRDNNLEYVTRF